MGFAYLFHLIHITTWSIFHLMENQTKTWKLRSLPTCAQLMGSRSWISNPCHVWLWLTGLDQSPGQSLSYMLLSFGFSAAAEHSLVFSYVNVKYLKVVPGLWHLFSNFLEVVQGLACLPYYFSKTPRQPVLWDTALERFIDQSVLSTRL